MAEDLASPPPAKRRCAEPEAGEEDPQTLLVSRDEQNNDDDDATKPLIEPSEPVKFQRIKRKKCALLLSYNGQGYLGMQLNPGTRTIERDLLEALGKAEAFPEEMTLDLGKLQFQRCSRTDKGVSAARQVVSIKMSPEKRVIELANQYLPPQIRIMGLRRVTKTFNSKTACSSRTYEYLLPTYAFAPYAWTTLDYRIDDSTREKVGRLIKMYEKSHNYHNFTSGKKYEEDSAMRHIISFTCDAPFLASRSSQPQVSNSTKQEKREEEREGKELQTSAKTETESSEVGNDAAKCGDRSAEDNVEMEEENADEEKSDDSITDCGHMEKEESKQTAKKVEFMTLKVKGQSFMIHQIRKMVGLVIAIVRGFAPETTLVEAFQKGKVDIPRAPALGLLLENVFFDAYNKKFGSDGSHEALDWKECTERVEEFKRQFIHQNIIDTEIDEMSMMQWLGSLQIHDFCSTKQRLLSAQRSEEELLIKGAEPPVGKEKTGDTNVSEESNNDV